MVPAVPAQASPHRSSRPPSPRRPSRPSRLASPPGRPSALRHRLSCPGAPPRPCQRGGTWPSLAPLPGQARAARTGLSRRRPWPSGNRCLPSPLTHPRRGTVQAESPASTLARPGTARAQLVTVQVSTSMDPQEEHDEWFNYDYNAAAVTNLGLT